jgi:hypothetical protein
MHTLVCFTIVIWGWLLARALFMVGGASGMGWET